MHTETYELRNSKGCFRRCFECYNQIVKNLENMFHIIQFRLFSIKWYGWHILQRPWRPSYFMEEEKGPSGENDSFISNGTIFQFFSHNYFWPTLMFVRFYVFFFCFFPHLDAKVALIFSYGYILGRFFYDLFKRIATFGGRLETGRSFWQTG